jgi:hypothetical protein
MLDTPFMLWELSVTEQRCRAVLDARCRRQVLWPARADNLASPPVPASGELIA